MRSDSDIEVIVPVYNTKPSLLTRCLDSILSQTYDKVRVLVINDGSTERKTLAVLNEYNKDNRVDVYHKKNGGASSARNYALSKTTARYVYFVDSDDYIDADNLEKLISVSSCERCGIVFSGKVHTKNNINDAPFKNHRIDIESDSPIIAICAHSFSSQGVLIDGDVARDTRFTESTMVGEDTEYIIKAMSKSEAYFYGGGGYNYVYNSESITNQGGVQYANRYLSDISLHKDLFEKYLKVSSDIITLYFLLKMARMTRLLCKGGEKYRSIKTLSTNFLDKYCGNRLRMKEIACNRHLGKGEKVSMMLLNFRLFGLLFAYDKLIIKIKK